MLLALSVLPSGVTECAADSSWNQAGIGCGSQAQLEEWEAARQGREGTLGRTCVKSAVLHPLGATLKMPNTIPSAHLGDQRTFGVCKSFLEILSSYYIRKKNISI